MPDRTHLIDETPGHPDALLDVADDAIGGLQAGVVVQRRPNLAANLLKAKKVQRWRTFAIKEVSTDEEEFFSDANHEFIHKRHFIKNLPDNIDWTF